MGKLYLVPVNKSENKPLQKSSLHIEINSSWRTVKHPEGAKLLDAIWVLKIKQDSNNTVKGFQSQIMLSRMQTRRRSRLSIHLLTCGLVCCTEDLFAIAVQYNLELVQFDIKTAFLYGKLKETIYVKIPKGLVVANKLNNVCLL